MAVLRNQRVEPLTLTADSLNTGVVGAWSWASEDGSTATSNGKDHSGNNRHFKANATTPPIVTTALGKGRDTSNGGLQHNIYYTAASANALGMGVGTGALSMWFRLRTPSGDPANTQIRSLGRLTDGSTRDPFSLLMYEIVGTGFAAMESAKQPEKVVEPAPVAPAAAPVTINLQVDAKQSAKKSIKIERDKDGNITSATTDGNE